MKKLLLTALLNVSFVIAATNRIAIFKFSQIDVKEISNLFQNNKANNNFILKDVKINIDTRTNSLVIIAPNNIFEFIKKFIYSIHPDVYYLEVFSPLATQTQNTN